MYNKKVISVLLSTIIASSTCLNIIPSINVFADSKQVYKNNLNEKFSLDMGEYKNNNGILSFPDAKGYISNKTNLVFTFDGQSNVKINYIKNRVKKEGITYEPSLKSRVINIKIENQKELDEVLKSLEITCENDVNFEIKLAGMPKGTISSNGVGQEEALDGDLGSHFRAPGQGWWQLLFDEETELDVINLTFGRKNGAEIQALKDGNWITIGDAEDYPIDLYSRETQTIKVDKGVYSGIKVIPRISDDNMSRLCEISFNQTEPQKFKYTKLDMGSYVDANGILTFPKARGIVDNPTYLRFDFNRNIYEDITITYSLNSEEKTLIGKNIKIPVKTQNELNEVLRTLKIDTKGNKKLGFDIILGGLALYKSVEGVPSRLYKAERAVDGNTDSFYGAINKNNSIFTILFEDETYIENVLIKANKNFTIKGLKNGSWTKIGDGTPELEKNESKKRVSVTVGEYEGIRIEQTHTGLDSCTISELEFNQESSREKINYNRSEYSLDLGNQSINNDGSISFKEASLKGNNVKLLINFEKSSNKNKISYTQNEKYIQKEGDSEITASSESELNEIIRSLKIYHDNSVENNVKITLLPDTFSFIENVPTGVLAQGNSLSDKYIAENVFSGSNGYFISGADNQLVLKNTKEFYINGVSFLNGNSIVMIKGLKNGVWEEIGKHSSNETEMINLVPGYYDEIKFASSSTLDIRNLYLRYSNIKEDIKLDVVKNNLNLGNYKIENNTITFPNAFGNINDTGFKLSLKSKDSESVNIKYKLNGVDIEKSNKNIDIDINTQEELEEFLKSLEINFNKKKGCNITVSIIESKTPEWGVPNSAIATGNTYSTNTPQKVFKGSDGYWNSGMYNDSLYVKGIENMEISAIRYYSTNFLNVRGKEKDGTWKDIGGTTPNADSRVLNLDKGFYDELQFYSYGSAWSHMANLEFLINSIKKEICSIEVEKVENKIPILNIPKNSSVIVNSDFDIMKDVTATDEEDGDLTNKITTKITNPSDQEVEVFDSSIIGSWKIEYIVTDSEKQTVNYIRTVRVDKNILHSLDLGKELVTSTFVKFPNARVLSEDEQEINGLKMYFSQGFNKDKVKIHYALNGVEKVSTEQKIELNNKFTIKEAEELIKSIKIEHDNSKEFKFTIKLNSNETDDIIYNYENNHYYKFIKADNIDWNKAKEEAEKEEFLGHKGYLVTVTSEQENIICNLFSSTVFWLGGFFENNIWKWVSGENFSSYSNWMPGQPDGSNGETHLEFYNKQWNDFDSFNSDKYPDGRPQGYIVEFGLNEKLPSPNTLDKFKYEDTATIKPIECKQDIVLNTFFEKNKNKVMLDWNNIKDIDHYNILLKEKEDFKIIKEQKDIYFEEDKKDIDGPSTPTHELFNSGIKQGINFNSEDVPSIYEYYIEGISEYGDITHISNKEKVEIKSGIKGFSYEVSNSSVPSISLGDVVNSTDGFISAKELASKLYVHVVSVDKAGNKSEVITLPIGGMFEDLPPVLNIGGNTSIEQGKVFDIMQDINAIDDYDGDLTSKVSVIIKNPSNKIVQSFDTTVLGKWTLEYIVSDSKGQESSAKKYVTVKENFDYLTINLGEPNRKRFLVTFPNVQITNNSNELIDGLKLYISEGLNNSITIKYSEKGVEKSVESQQLILTGKYTTEEVTNIIKSIKIEHDNSTSFRFNIRLQNNKVDEDESTGGTYKYEDSVQIDNIFSKQDIVLSATNDSEVNLYWSEIQDAKYYNVIKTEIEKGTQTVKKVLKNELKDIDSKDVTVPEMEFSLKLSKEMTAELEFNTEDIGTEYEYKVESYDNDNYQTAYSNTAKVTRKSGFKGYSYIIDENPNTELNKDVNNKDGKFKFEHVTDNTYLHICAIDNEGNATETKHIRLADDSYNNKPRIKVPAINQIISIGDNFDKFKNISAYDFEDGDLTDKISVEGEVNSNIKGVYELKYTVLDSKGLKAETIVKVHVTGDMELDIKQGDNKLDITWKPVKNAKKYKLYKTKADGYDFEEVGVFDENILEYSDNKAIDKNSPVISYFKEIKVEEAEGKVKLVAISKEISNEVVDTLKNTILEDTNEKTKLKIVCKDLGSTYRYFIEALDENEQVVNSSEVKNEKVNVGLAGYSYIIDEKEDTEPLNIVNVKDVDNIDISKSKFKFIHLKAIDKNGNVSKTIHHLINGKYDTNYIPVIKGVYTTRVQEGEKFDALKGITAYDVEDGDITSKIEIDGEVDINKNGKYILNYKVEDSQGNKREVRRYVLVHGDMEIKVTPNLENNNMTISWDKNILGDDVFYEIRKWNNIEGDYTTIGYTEDFNFIDKDAKDMFGPTVMSVSESKLEDEMEQNFGEEESQNTQNNNIEEKEKENEHQTEKDSKEDKSVKDSELFTTVENASTEKNRNEYLRLTINAKDIGVSEKYQVRTRLKEDNLIIRDMMDERGNDWGVGNSFSSTIKYYRYKLSNKRNDNLEDGDIKTTISSDMIEFDPKDYKYIHFMPVDGYGNLGQIVHYELGEIGIDETITPPVIEGAGDKEILIDSKFDVLKGIIAYDYKCEDLTEFIKIEGFVNINKVGMYKLIYSVMDFKGQSTIKSCDVRVIDYNENLPPKKPEKLDEYPVLNMYGEEVYITVGEKYNVMNGINVIDKEDGDLTNKITYTTNLDTDVVGDYIVSYSVRDSADNRLKWNRIVHVVPKGIDIPANPSDDIPEGAIFPELYTESGYVKVGDDFNVHNNVYAKDVIDGDITSKVKVSGYVNTLKPAIYNLTYKVTNSSGNTSIRGRSVYVFEGNWGNDGGTKPKPDPDWGGNDDGENDGGNIPAKPDQPNQKEDDLPPSNLPDVDKDGNNDKQDDIFIDKNGNIIKPSGEIETPDGVIVKPSEDGENPKVDEEGNIIIPPGGIIIFPNGTIQIPEDGAILKPDGVIIYPKKDEEIKDKDSNSKDESSNSIDSLINNDKIEKEISNIKKIKSPDTGEKGVGIFWGIGILSTIGLTFINRRKNK
ncbi:TPA: immunoglobulin-like domain-containing protein [Clostridioides difficile]